MTTGWFCGSIESSCLRLRNIRTPVKTRKTPNTYSTHSALWISVLPRKMNPNRITMAPRIPQKSTFL